MKSEEILARLRQPVGITVNTISGVLLLHKKGFGRKAVARKMGVTVRRVRTIIKYAGVKPHIRGEKWAKDDYRRKVLRGLRSLSSGRAGYNSVYGVYRNVAKKKDLPWRLTKEQFGILVQSACHYCGSLPRFGSVFSWAHRGRPRSGKFYYNGIDRKNSDKGYTPQNTVSCCASCNRAKSDQTLSKFRTWIQRLINFQQEAA